MGISVQILALAVGLTFAACETIGVTIDYEPSTSFSNLETWAWLEERPGHEADTRPGRALVGAPMRRAVREELAARGYRELTSGEPDFYVLHHAAVNKKLDLHSVPRHYDHSAGWTMIGTETYVTEYEEGTLVLDVIEPERRDLIWRGTAEARIDRSAGPEKREERIRKAVRKMLDRFPPQ